MADEGREEVKQEHVPEIIRGVENISTSNDASVEQQYDSDEVLSFLKDNSIILCEIKEIIESRLEYDDVKEKAFDKLYEEMRRQKEVFDLLDRTLKPVLSDLLLLHDSMKKFGSILLNQSIITEGVIQNYKYIEEEMTAILYRQDVLPIDANSEEIFNSKIHKVAKIEGTERKEDDFKIVNILRDGFVWRDKVLRPQEVVIKRFSV